MTRLENVIKAVITVILADCMGSTVRTAVLVSLSLCAGHANE